MQPIVNGSRTRSIFSCGSWFLLSAPVDQPVHVLVCFHHAGGAASAYRGIAYELKASAIEVWSVQTLGRDNRLGQAALESISDVARSVAREIASRIDVPYSLFGHSLGAVTAFETARELARLAAPQPKWLFASGHADPALDRIRPPLHTLDDAEFVTTVADRYGGIPRYVIENAELLELVRPVLRADMKMIETYRFEPGPPLDCDVVALVGGEDDTVEQAALLQWRHHTRGSSARHVIPGDHFYLYDHIREVAAIVRQCLAGRTPRDFA